MEEFVLAPIPELQLVLASVGPRQDHVIADVQGVACYFGSKDRRDYAFSPDVPNVDLYMQNWIHFGPTPR